MEMERRKVINVITYRIRMFRKERKSLDMYSISNLEKKKESDVKKIIRNKVTRVIGK